MHLKYEPNLLTMLLVPLNCGHVSYQDCRGSRHSKRNTDTDGSSGDGLTVSGVTNILTPPPPTVFVSCWKFLFHNKHPVRQCSTLIAFVGNSLEHDDTLQQEAQAIGNSHNSQWGGSCGPRTHEAEGWVGSLHTRPTKFGIVWIFNGQGFLFLSHDNLFHD